MLLLGGRIIYRVSVFNKVTEVRVYSTELLPVNTTRPEGVWIYITDTDCGVAREKSLAEAAPLETALDSLNILYACLQNCYLQVLVQIICLSEL